MVEIGIRRLIVGAKARIATLLLCCIFVIYGVGETGANDLENPGTLKASSILEPELVKGKHHEVEDVVKNDGLLNHYTVNSSFGKFRVTSTSSLRNLVREIEAIAAMRKVETDDTAIKSLKKSGENTITGLKNLFSEPEETFENAAEGVRGLFNRAKGTIGKREITGAEDSRVEQIIGMSKSKGQIATKFGVNMYSRNEVLQTELDRLAMGDYLGGLGMGVATSFVPGVGGLILTTSGTARLLNEAINSTPASELWLQNNDKLLSMGMNGDTVKLFLNNPHFSPALQTILVTALESLKGAENRELFVKVALQASDTDMAKIITETAVLTAGYHKNVNKINKIEPMARLTKVVSQKGALVVVLPTDYVSWNRKVADITKDLIEKARQKNIDDYEIWTTGRFSPKAEKELQAIGWKLHASSQQQLLKKDQ